MSSHPIQLSTLFCKPDSTKRRLAGFPRLINFEQHLLIIRQFRARETRGSHTRHYNCRRIFTSRLSFFIRAAILVQCRRERHRTLSALPITRTRDNYIACPHVELLKRKFRKKLVKIPLPFFTEKYWNFYFVGRPRAKTNNGKIFAKFYATFHDILLNQILIFVRKILLYFMIKNLILLSSLW